MVKFSPWADEFPTYFCCTQVTMGFNQPNKVVGTNKKKCNVINKEQVQYTDVTKKDHLYEETMKYYPSGKITPPPPI